MSHHREISFDTSTPMLRSIRRAQREAQEALPARCLATAERYQIRHYRLEPGESWDVQIHLHADKVWMVVAGTAQLHHKDHTQMLSEGETHRLSIGEACQLVNAGFIPLEIIELRAGSYLEDDAHISADFASSRPALAGVQPQGDQ